MINESSINHGQGLNLLNKYLKKDNNKKHCLASEAIMRAVAERLGKNAEEWGIAGLLHDLDFELTEDKPEKHGRITIEILKEFNVGGGILHAILSHNEENINVKRETDLDFALTCSETITGLIVATALVMPNKKLSSVSAESILKRMKEKDFARKINRDLIKLCEKIGIPLEEFIKISLNAMQKISDKLGL